MKKVWFLGGPDGGHAQEVITDSITHTHAASGNYRRMEYSVNYYFVDDPMQTDTGSVFVHSSVGTEKALELTKTHLCGMHAPAICEDVSLSGPSH